MIRKLVLVGLASTALILGFHWASNATPAPTHTLGTPAAKATDAGAKKPGHLADAQAMVKQALGSLDAAQGAGEWDMDGHASSAHDKLQQADAALNAAINP